MTGHRRHLNAGQKAFVALAALPLFEAEAAQRMAQAPGAPRGVKQAPAGADLPQETERAPQARDHAAAQVGVSGRAVSQARRVTEQVPDLAAAGTARWPTQELPRNFQGGKVRPVEGREMSDLGRDFSDPYRYRAYRPAGGEDSRRLIEWMKGKPRSVTGLRSRAWRMAWVPGG